MAFNAQVLLELEMAGLTNAALEQMLILVHSRQGCNVTLHISDGAFVRMQCAFVSNMRQPRATQQVTATLERLME